MAIVRVNVLGKERMIKESIRKVKRTFIVQKIFIGLDKNIDSKDDETMVDASIKLLDQTTQYIADMVGDDVTVDRLEDEMTFEEAKETAEDIINAILHIEPDEVGESDGKKLTTTKLSESSTTASKPSTNSKKS